VAQLVTKVSELIEHSVALLIVDEGKWSCLGRRVWALSWSLETHTTDIQVLLETIQLQKIGKFQCADISARGAYFLLEVGDDSLQVSSVKAGPEELVPEPLTLEAQA
jgi:hypothetical protein